MIELKVLYKSSEIYLVKINDKMVYYGNGETINELGSNSAQFLRFNPYMEDVSEADVEIPQKIIEYISKHKG